MSSSRGERHESGSGSVPVRLAAPDRLAHSVAEAAALLDMSEHGVRNAIDRGHLRAIRIGRKILVPRKSIEDLLNGPANGNGAL